jgi:rRNA maturation endonuclease Nob1
MGAILMLISSNGKITKCDACDGKVSKQAHVCPHCGHPQDT